MEKDKWIDCKKQLPNKDGYYSCWDEPIGDTEKYYYADKQFRNEKNGILNMTSDVTHWQPLPYPPPHTN